MAVAERVQVSGAADAKARLGGLFGVEFAQLHAVHRYVGDEAHKVILSHGVVERDVPFVLDALDLDRVRSLLGRVLRILRHQLASAARERPLAERRHHVPADGADVELGAQKVARTVGVLAHLSGEELGHGDAERSGKPLHERDIG